MSTTPICGVESYRVADIGDSSGIEDLLDTDERAGSDWSVRFER